MTAQPKPTAADVLTTHARIGPRGQCRCGWYPAMRLNDTEADRRQHDQHQADMLAAAGLLATPEHDAQVAARALREWVAEWPTDPGDGTFLADVARDGRARAARIEGGDPT